MTAMKFTATFQGRIGITKSSSSVDRTLSEGDFEFMLDSFSDALDLQPGLENLSVGAILQAGKLEVTFVVDAAYLVEAQKAALSAFNEANVVTAARLANRIGGPLNLEWASSHTNLTDLVTA